MSGPDVSCPLCDADLVFAGDEKAGDSIVCSFCGAPFVLKHTPAREGDGEGWDLEEDM